MKCQVTVLEQRGQDFGHATSGRLHSSLLVACSFKSFSTLNVYWIWHEKYFYVSLHRVTLSFNAGSYSNECFVSYILYTLLLRFNSFLFVCFLVVWVDCFLNKMFLFSVFPSWTLFGRFTGGKVDLFLKKWETNIKTKLISISALEVSSEEKNWKYFFFCKYSLIQFWNVKFILEWHIFERRM